MATSGAQHLIGSGAGDCAPAPSHTTGRAVFRIRRLNAAALHMVDARSDGIQNHDGSAAFRGWSALENGAWAEIDNSMAGYRFTVRKENR